MLVLLGFAATDFLITMTLSAADATAHLVENPFVPEVVHGHNVAITLLLALLGGIFLAGFSEAIGIAVALVATYLALNFVVVVVSAAQLLAPPRAGLKLVTTPDQQVPRPAAHGRGGAGGVSQTCPWSIGVPDRCRGHAAHPRG